jgi:Dyp-type peroxidase family
MLLLYARDAETMAVLRQDERAAAEADGGLAVVHEISPEPLPGVQSVGKFGVEHFGFADGMSQPVVRGTAQADRLGGASARRDVVAAGEFVLGCPNGYGRLTPSPVLNPTGPTVDLGRNGSYLVVRQLAQDVAAFRMFLRAQSTGGSPSGTTDPDAEEQLGAKLVGRWRSGAPLVESPHRDDPDLGADNSFGYRQEDPDGRRCPFGSHIRRSNPRDSLGPSPSRALELTNLHRILRRGRVYGPGLPEDADTDDGVERGLVFLAINANLERQFEFVQQTWVNNPKFAGLYDEQDPLIGSPPEDGGTFTVQGSPFARRLTGLPSFVTVKGGAYFFLPGLRGLRALADLT